MKTIRIGFCGFHSYEGKLIDVENNIITEMLRKHYNVEICENPDYIICSIFDDDYFSQGILDTYLQYDGIRILVEGENYVPDYNLVDYSICSYPIHYYDRNFYLPCGVEAFYRCNFSHFLKLKCGKRCFTKQDLQEKQYFANFIYGHESEYAIRDDFYRNLSVYKRVESAGNWLNNIPEERRENLWWTDDSKVNFQKKCKFTICFESTMHEGFITEKIVDAFLADTIPIYWGSKSIGEIFNKKAFIDCNDYKSFDDVIEQVKRIDSDDELFIQMLCEPIFNQEDFPEQLITGLESFLVHIFDQDIEKAFRRSKAFSPANHERFITNSQKHAIKKYDRLKARERIIRLPFRLAKKVLGERRYTRVKNLIKGE